MNHLFEVVWVGSTYIWGSDSKIGPHEKGSVTWDIYQRRPGLTKRLLPWPTFVEYLDQPHALRAACLALELPADSPKAAVLRHYSGSSEPVEAEADKLVSEHSKPELVELCVEFDLPTTGNKPELAARLAQTIG